MKKKVYLIISFIFIIISITKGDTTDHYSIFYNDIKVLECSANSNDTIPLVFNKSNVKENDNLTVKYLSDSICSICKYYLVIIDNEKRYVKVVSKTGQGTPLTFSLIDVLNWSNEYISNKFEIYYYAEKPAFPVHLFTLFLNE